MVKLPPMLLSVDPKENVTKLAAVITKVVPTETMAGNDIEVTVANVNAMFDVTDANAASETVVAAASVSVYAPVTVTKLGREKFVTSGSVNVRIPVFANTGIENVEHIGSDIFMVDPITAVCRFGRLYVVRIGNAELRTVPCPDKI
jgi:hypothetical protein